MAERDIERLLGGYATGTLTEPERRRLFEVALHDQELFDALSDEHALKEILDDPQCRRRLRRALEACEGEAAGRPFGSLWQWLRRPAALATAGGLAAGFLALWILIVVQREARMPPPEGDQVVRLSWIREEAETEAAQEVAKDSVAPSALHAETERAETALPKESVPSKQLASRAAPAAPPDRRRKAAPVLPVPSALPLPEPRPPWLIAHHRPMKAGPARRWYHARRDLVQGRKGRPQAEALPDTRAEEAAEALAPTVSVERELTGGDVRPLGLRYSVLREGEDGELTETFPSGPFRPDDALRVAIEVNEAGYLYVFRLGPRGTWTWLSSADPVGQAKKHSRPAIGHGKRYLLPETGVLPLYGEPAVNKIVVIYSRQPRQELQAFRPSGLERQEGDDTPLADLESLLSRARIETSTQPLLVEQVSLEKADAPPERAVYIVNPEAGPDTAIAIELTFPP